MGKVLDISLISSSMRSSSFIILRDASPCFPCSDSSPRLEGLKFSAAHFVAFDGFREPMHGHNYTVAAQIGAQSLQHDGYVVDFGDVKKVLRTICRRLGIPKAAETSWVGLKKSEACVPILI